MDMSSLMTVAVGREGADIYELSDFLEESVIPELERQEGRVQHFHHRPD